MAKAMGTNGGGNGMNGAQRRLLLILGAGFVLTLAAVMLANVESTMSDFADAGIRETRAHVWIWQATSVLAWFTTAPAIWWLIAHVRPPRFSWPAVAALIILASVPLSLWHIGVMVGLRKLSYALAGSHYLFFDKVSNPLLYEYRKDLASYFQFAGFAAIAHWLFARAAIPASPHPQGRGRRGDAPGAGRRDRSRQCSRQLRRTGLGGPHPAAPRDAGGGRGGTWPGLCPDSPQPPRPPRCGAPGRNRPERRLHRDARRRHQPAWQPPLSGFGAGLRLALSQARRRRYMAR
jgi:hypothetical protein